MIIRSPGFIEIPLKTFLGATYTLTAMLVSGVHHHKQLYHHRGREGQEEAGSRSQANLMWNGDPANQYAGRSRNYADGAGASTIEGMGYRYRLVRNQTACGVFHSFRWPQLICVCVRSAVVKAARCRGEDARRQQRHRAKVMRVGGAWRRRYQWRIWRETRRSCNG